MFNQQFDDIYFSREDGLAESRHTYLAGNDLPNAWNSKSAFHILELGFGSGLNFLATLKLWQETALTDQQLRYTAIEKYPLAWNEIAAGLAHWQDDLGEQLAALKTVYPQDLPGRHAVIFGNVTLDIICMDVAAALPLIETPVNAFYLDGFAPAKNPDMWSADVFMQIGRLSRIGSSFATFTVAAVARHGAQDAGFVVQKLPGYGRKREMLIGRYLPV